MFKILFRYPHYQYEKGQDLAEYALLLGLSAMLVVDSITLIGTSISEIFNALAVAIQAGV
ncbi:MAG: Flp family type IVb pilin [Chloroflexota bacterium]|nr:MAG: Flp family type IVb pilin [Chloroflexota bacterium]